MGTVKCSHPYIELIEAGTASTSHIRLLNGEWIHDSNFHDYTGVLIVKCPNCNHKKTFTKHRPKWLAQLFAEATADSSTEVTL